MHAKSSGIAVTGSNSLVLSPILADVALGLGTTPVAVSRPLAAYGGATALSAFLLAPRIDRVGPRRALTAGMAALTAATLLSAAATHWVMLVLAQIVAGICAEVDLPSIYALATTIAPKGSELAVLGRVLTGWSVSLVIGVPASALIADLAGWRASFLALAVLAAASLATIPAVPIARSAATPKDRRRASREIPMEEGPPGTPAPICRDAARRRPPAGRSRT